MPEHLSHEIFEAWIICQLSFATGHKLLKSIQSVTLLKKRLRRRCFPLNSTRFFSTSSLQNTSGCFITPPPLFYIFFCKFGTKKFSEWFQYFRNFSCKLSLEIVWFSQSLSVHYLKILKSPQCDRQSEALLRYLKICPLSKRPPRCFQHIPKILEKRPIYPDYFFSCDYDIY